MRVWTYCICRNEAKMMPYFLRHYGTFCDRMVFFDDQSDDGTRTIIQSGGGELHDWPGTHGMVDDEFLDFANYRWKEARGNADWVMWLDADEFIYHPSIKELLQTYKEQKVMVPQIQGYAMVWPTFPETDGQIYDLVKTGFASPEWSKPVVFNPIIDMAWNPGRHSLNIVPGGLVSSSQLVDLKLLHYRYFGMDYINQRAKKNYERQPEKCRMLNYGDNHFPGATKHYSPAWLEEILKQSFENVI